MENQHITSLFDKYKTPLQKSRDTERGDLMKYFIVELNMSRDKLNQHNYLKFVEQFPATATHGAFQRTKIYLKPLTYPRMARLLTHLLEDGTRVALPLVKLYRLKSLCRTAKNFSSTFYYYVTGEGKL